MYITGGEAQRNRRIGIPNPIQKQEIGNRLPSDCVGDSRQIFVSTRQSES
ncbi:MAG: hypothetical protein LBU34_06170 [Planctomycetaceae bacterium]|jgi:hypothetical protein|nr:hypothetical protein [Planctomycetaceae bacterium]